MRPTTGLITSLTRHAATVLETHLGHNGNDWISKEDVFSLLVLQYSEMLYREIDELLFGEAILAGSLLERIDVDGPMMFRPKPDTVHRECR